jgi:cytochrome c oxidase subunit 3
MATTVTSTRPLTKPGIGGGPKPRGPNGNGGPKGNGHDRVFSQLQSSANRYRIGMWVALASITMMFTALSSAYIVRAASSNDWQPLKMPRVLLLSTALILVSSGTLEAARRKWKETVNSQRRWLLVTVVLGIGFLLSQLLAWRQLVRQGVYVASNPHSSFFYLLTAAHGVHLLGGLTALVYLSLRPRPQQDNQQANHQAVAKSQASADAVALYWHFMDFLWLYLFVLLFFVR